MPSLCSLFLGVLSNWELLGEGAFKHLSAVNDHETRSQQKNSIIKTTKVCKKRDKGVRPAFELVLNVRERDKHAVSIVLHLDLFSWCLVFICKLFQLWQTCINFFERQKTWFFLRARYKSYLSRIDSQCVWRYIIVAEILWQIVKVRETLQWVCLILHIDLHMSDSYRNP